jgi:hypothetical protein
LHSAAAPYRTSAKKASQLLPIPKHSMASIGD